MDAAVAELAERQHGPVSTAQLRALGVTEKGVEVRVRKGWLHRVHRGVYAVGHKRLTWRGRLWAAILACGGPDRAALSHLTAAAVHDLLPPPKVIDVTTLGQSGRREGMRVHRSTTVDPLVDVVRQPDGLPVTTPMRTLLDIAAPGDQPRLRRACRRAELLRLIDVAAIPPSGRGATRLRRAVEALGPAEPAMTRSELEERFLDLLDGAGLPRPEVNAVVEGHEVDFVWRTQRLIVETDGRAAHLTPGAFERDRARDVELQVAGWTVVRFTWRQVVEEGEVVAERVRALLRACGPAAASPATRRAA